MREAFITAVTSQGRSYLAEFLLARGYEVHGLIQRGKPHRPAWTRVAGGMR